MMPIKVLHNDHIFGNVASLVSQVRHASVGPIRHFVELGVETCIQLHQTPILVLGIANCMLVSVPQVDGFFHERPLASLDVVDSKRTNRVYVLRTLRHKCVA